MEMGRHDRGQSVRSPFRRPLVLATVAYVPHCVLHGGPTSVAGNTKR